MVGSFTSTRRESVSAIFGIPNPQIYGEKPEKPGESRFSGKNQQQINRMIGGDIERLQQAIDTYKKLKIPIPLKEYSPYTSALEFLTDDVLEILPENFTKFYGDIRDKLVKRALSYQSAKLNRGNAALIR